MDIKVEVPGLKGLEDAMSQAGPKLAKRIVRRGIQAGTAVIVKAVKDRTPILKKGTPQRRPGELRDSYTSKIKLSPKEEYGVAIIGAEYKKSEGNQSPGVYDIMVEFGSIHGAAQPHMRPGYDESKERALEAFTDVTREGVESLKA